MPVCRQFQIVGRFYYLMSCSMSKFAACLTIKSYKMKKSIEISAHLLFWLLFTAFTIMLSKSFLEVKPDAPFAAHFAYVVFLEVVMGLIFFYTTYSTLPWAMKKSSNLIVLICILLGLTVFFALPVMKIGMLQVLSSVIPHVFLIFLAVIFRKLSDSNKLIAKLD